MTEKISGGAFKQMVAFGAACITREKQAINDLNVFPVPDGDTGTNMSLTIQTAAAELKKCEPATVGEAAKITASALLRGARGNSGVILSLLFRGLSKSAKGLEEMDGVQLAAAMSEGVTTAYGAVMKPAEGTVLTVSRLAAARAEEAAQEQNCAEYVLAEAIATGYETLAETTEMNPVLKKAGVVDAGGKGYLIILEGMLSSLRGEPMPEVEEEPEHNKADFAAIGDEDITFAFDTVFIVRKHTEEVDLEPFRTYLNSIGDSLVIGEDDTAFKVHVHTNTLSCLLCACNRENRTNLPQPQVTGVADSLETVPPEEKPKAISAEQIEIKKDLLYDKYTLEDTYPYKDTTRSFQWDKIKERLALLENIQQTPSQWGILQNYKNRNGEAPLVRHYKRNAYKRIADTLGIERYQSVPLYLLTDTLVPERYGEDGSLVRFLADGENFVKVSPIYIGEEWYVPKRYVKVLPDTTHFIKTIMIDRRDQNIMTLEQTGEAQWTVRSMNPATTGRHRPPYAQETPLGIFVLQEKKTRMIFLKDGSTATGGFAPYASRFSDGGYIHGVPVNEPRKALIEYSPSLGTTPRSHMCVRNATSHSKFIFDWAPVNETIIFVLE